MTLDLYVDTLDTRIRTDIPKHRTYMPANIPNYHVAAKFNVDINIMKKVFTYATPNNPTSQLLQNNVKINYYINMKEWPNNYVVNAVNAMVDFAYMNDKPNLNKPHFPEPLPSSQRLTVKNEYLNYLAYTQFNNVNLIDLIENDVQLYEDMVGNCGAFEGSGYKQLLNSLKSISMESSSQTMCGTHPCLYVTNQWSNSNNIGNVILTQMRRRAPERFLNYELIVDDDCIEKRKSFPFQVGDSLCYILTIEPSDSSEMSKYKQILPRKYLIRLVMTDLNNCLNTMPGNTAYLCDYVSNRTFPSYNVIKPDTQQQILVLTDTNNSFVNYVCPLQIPIDHSKLKFGWYFTNKGSNLNKRINWFLTIKETDMRFDEINFIYATIQLFSVVTLPKICVYLIDKTIVDNYKTYIDAVLAYMSGTSSFNPDTDTTMSNYKSVFTQLPVINGTAYSNIIEYEYNGQTVDYTLNKLPHKINSDDGSNYYQFFVDNSAGLQSNIYTDIKIDGYTQIRLSKKENTQPLLSSYIVGYSLQTISSLNVKEGDANFIVNTTGYRTSETRIYYLEPEPHNTINSYEVTC